MSAPFRLDGWTFSAACFDVLGDVAGYNAHEARGRWARAGSECTDRQSYVLSEATVRAIFGPRGVDALIAAELGERCDGGIRMLRLDGAIEWYDGIASKRRRAGQARAATARRDERGRLLPSSMSSTQPAHAGVLDQRTASTAPAHSSSPVPDPVPDRSEDSLAPARAIPPSTEAEARTGNVAGPPRDELARDELARDVWSRVSAARVEIAAELGIKHVLPMPPSFGSPSEPRGCRDLRERVLEEGGHAAIVCKHVVDNLVAQAREERTVEWLSEKAFTPGGWQTARNWLPGQQQRRRAGPRGSPSSLIGSAKPRNDHPESATLIPISEL